MNHEHEEFESPAINEMSLYQLADEFVTYEETLTTFFSQERPTRNKFESDDDYEAAVASFEIVEKSLRELEENLVTAIGNKVDGWAAFLSKLESELEIARKEARRIDRVVKIRAKRYERASTFLKTCLDKMKVQRLKGSLHEIKIYGSGGKKAVEYDGQTWVRSEFAGSQYANLGRVVSKLMSDGLINDEVRRLAGYFTDTYEMSPKDALERAYLSYLTEGESERFDYDADKIRAYAKSMQELPAGFSIVQKTHLRFD